MGMLKFWFLVKEFVENLSLVSGFVILCNLLQIHKISCLDSKIIVKIIVYDHCKKICEHQLQTQAKISIS